MAKKYSIMTSTVAGRQVLSILPEAKTLKFAFYLSVKRMFDIFVGLIGCALLLPLTIIIKVAYVLSGDFAPIFYAQERIGQYGTTFRIWKFRSMIPDADKKLKEILKNDKELAKEYRKNKKLEHDPRVTKAGQIMRKFSIDEFPQFFNVLKGDMSLIGNRPYLLREKEEMGSYYSDIISVRPGIVSLWAIRGRSEVDFEERLKIEHEYSRTAGLRKDFVIMVKSVAVVFAGKGAK